MESLLVWRAGTVEREVIWYSLMPDGRCKFTLPWCLRISGCLEKCFESTLNRREMLLYLNLTAVPEYAAV